MEKGDNRLSMRWEIAATTCALDSAVEAFEKRRNA